MRPVVMLAAAMIMGACARTPPATEQTEARMALDSLAAALQDAVVRKDAPAIATLFAPDAVLYGADGALLSGREAIAARVAEQLPLVRGYFLSPQDFGVGGDVAYEAQSYQLTLAEADTSRVISGSQLVVLRRAADGRWRIARLGSWAGAPPEPHVH